MIEGFKLRVTAHELREHLDARSKYHAGRAEEKKKELPALRDALVRVSEAGRVSKHMSSSNVISNSTGYRLDPEEAIEQLERDIEDHSLKSIRFGFYAAHLFEDNYTLTASELASLEFIRQ